MNDSKKYQRKEANQACIYPLIHSLGGKFFRVTITRNGRVFEKSFFEQRCGGHDRALRMATAWRDQVILENPARTRSNFCCILRSNNTSGIPGVFRRHREHKARNGKLTSYDCWQAQLPTPEGQVHRKSFSVSQYGEEGAREMAIAARQEALRLLEDSTFRPTVQPEVVSSQEDIDDLQKALEARQAKRIALLDERARRREQREKRAMDRELRAAMEERKRLERPTNQTGYPYISRCDAPSAHWRVALDVNGTRYRKTFSDAVNGGKAGALRAAVTWRDDIFHRIKLPAEAARLAARAQVPADLDQIEAVARRKADKPRASDYWIAYAPKRYGMPRKARKFSIAKYGEDEAHALAIEARRKFLEDTATPTAGLHLVARKLLSAPG